MLTKNIDKSKVVPRYDKRFGWPNGVMQEEFLIPGGNTLFPSVLDPDLTQEQIDEGRETFNAIIDAYAANYDLKPEYVEHGDFADVVAPGCIEEPETSVPVHLRIPKNPKVKPTPVLMYIYGPGFAGNAAQSDAEIAQLSYDLDCVVVAPTFRHYPENKYPTQVNDFHAAYQWILDNAEEYNLDTDRIAVYGLSAGGLYGLCLAHRLQKYGQNMRGVVAVCPAMDDRGYGRSGQFSYDAGDGSPDCNLSNWYMNMFNYATLGYDHVNCSYLPAEAIPAEATPEECKHMTPVFLHVMEHDPCRDATIKYAQKLLDADVLCKLHVWPGVHHSGFCSGDLSDPYKQRYWAEKMQDLEDVLYGADLRRPWLDELEVKGE